MPAQDRLRRRHAVLSGDAADHLVTQDRPTGGEGAPRLGEDPVLRVEGPQLGLLEVRVQLDLVDGGQLTGLVAEALQMVDLELHTPTARTRPPSRSSRSALHVST